MQSLPKAHTTAVLLRNLSSLAGWQNQQNWEIPAAIPLKLEPKPYPRDEPKRIWQNAAMLAGMLAFLVFSDWFNPGDKKVELADGTRFEAILQYETEGSYDLRLKQAAFGHQTADVVRLAKSEITSIADVDTWVTRIHHYRWHLAGAMGVAVAIMCLSWLNRQDFSSFLCSLVECSSSDFSVP
jgi:uncharacterized protein